jgi:SAM-dependent methyltransferase
MDDDQRRAVLDNARYLRQVRPIDPEEIHEYVEGRPHPGAVRQVLRERAPDLGLVEREDGTFGPAPDGPASPAFEGVEAFPERHARALADLLVERFGPGWPDGDSGDRLRARVREVKERYLRGRSVEYDPVTALGYAVYHLPTTYAAVQYVLADLAADGRLPASPRILDVGSGVGGPALGMSDLLGEGLVSYDAVEPSAAADVLERLLEETGPNVHASVHRTTAESFEPEGRYDVVLFANVLSELDDPATVVVRYLDALAEDGSVVALAPADRNTATGLRAVERTVEREAGTTVYAPTVRLWPHETPDSDSWSFDVRADIDVPPFQQRLDEGTRTTERAGTRAGRPGDGEFVNVDVQYAFGVWRRDDRRRVAYRPDPERTAKLAAAGSFVTERVNLAAIKLSHDLAADGNPLFLVGDGSQSEDVFAVVTESSTLNRDLVSAGYGDPLRFENALVLWNDDECAYNVVVDGETVVDRVPG